MRVIEHGIACAVPHAIWGWLANRAWGRSPQITVGVIAQKDAIARRIAHRIVVPRSDAVEEAVRGPRDSASSLAHAESTDGIPHDIDPRRRRKITARQVNLIFAVLVEAAQAVERLKPSAGVRRLRVNRHRAEWDDVAVHDLELGWISVLDTRELEEIPEAEPVAVHLNASHRLEERDVFRLKQVRPPDEDATGPIEQAGLARRHGRRQQLIAQLLHVRRRVHVENHEVAGDSLQSPVVVSSEQLPDARHSHRTFNRCQKDRPITGNAEAPQRLLPEFVLFDRALGGTESRMREHQMPRQILIQRGVCWRDPQIPQLRLRLRPRQVEGASSAVRIVV